MGETMDGSIDPTKDHFKLITVMNNVMTGKDKENGPDISQLLSQWRVQAYEQGDTVAQINLAICYLYGSGNYTKNETEGIKLLQSAVGAGHAIAQINLACAYMRGIGVEENKSKAVKLYQDAANQGEAIAQYFLGLCYWKGICVSRDLVEAVRLFRLAADQGYADACCLSSLSDFTFC
jgi:TPR repeat protein